MTDKKQFLIDAESMRTIQTVLSECYHLLGEGTFKLSHVSDAIAVRKNCADVNNQIEDLFSNENKEENEKK